MNQQHCLIELFTEELPPKALLKLRDSFQQSMQTQLEQAQCPFNTIKPFATPRRLALLITDLHETQPDQQIERKGPALSAAYDKEGKPTPACTGFARSCGITIDQLEALKTDQGEWLYCKVTKPGEHIQQWLPPMITAALKQLPIPKAMRWGDRDDQFARPVHNLIVLFGQTVIPMAAYGCQSINTLHGHRFMTTETQPLTQAEHYEASLESSKVIADFSVRQQHIRDSIEQRVSKQFTNEAKAVINPSLLDEVTALVEWPQALIVPFDPTFLSVPKEALISAMEQHQKCFALTDNKGQLLPFFITISNLDSLDPEQVILGNQRVMHARLSDAAFFYQTDCKTTLEQLTQQLHQITYEKRLGSLHDKVTRVTALARDIAATIHADESITARAATLAKADLVTLMVAEFPELQGIMGQYYAKHDGEADAVATAIAEHYLPRHAGDQLPQRLEGTAVAIADRLDTLVGIIGIGNAPTGDKDPFALRRASLSVLRLLIEKKISLDLNNLITKAMAQFPADTLTQPGLDHQLLQFFADRFRSIAQENSIDTDVFLSVQATGISDPYTAFKKMQAVAYFKQLPEAASLASANKRVSNILKKQKITAAMSFDPSLLIEAAEKNLAAEIDKVTTHFNEALSQSNDQKALLSLTELNQPINAFFEHVMVMTDDDALKNNRIALLQKARALFLHIADIALLQ